MAEPDSYISYTVPKLKRELARRQAATTGRKTDLIERLRAYDRNDNFRGKLIDIPEPLDNIWPSSGFSQLLPHHQGTLPPISKELTEGYFIYRMAGDLETMNDLKAIEKGRRMFTGDRILACSLLSEGLSTTDSTYFSGIVGAAMKNKVHYNYKIKVDRTGAPVISHCECPAGQGPHATCKHIAAVLLMLEHFVNTGSLHLQRSCTENLQTFHKPKSSYKGSPMKAESMPSKRQLSSRMMEDPRPPKYRKMAGYNDFVRNMMVNYSNTSSQDISLKYLHPKADLQSAVHDHDYLDRPFTENWIDRALQLTEDEAITIEERTRHQSSSQLWHKERKWRITSSRFGEVVKMTDRRNKSKLCSTFHCQITTKALIHGKQYENKAISEFEKSYNIKTKKAGFFVDSNMPFLGATPDAVIDDDYLVEVKCPYAGRNDLIRPGKKFPYLCFNSRGQISLKHNSNYYHQIQGQLYIAKRKFCYFVVYTFCDLFVEIIELDSEYFQYSMLPKLELFHQRHLKPYIASNL